MTRAATKTLAEKIPWGYLYETTDNLNGIFYLGILKSIKFVKTYYGSGIHLVSAIKKYGIENFTVRLMQWAYSKDELGNLEIDTIARYREFFGRSQLYNVAPGGYPFGGGMLGVKLTKRHKNRISKSNRERAPMSKVGRKNISLANKGSKRTPEQIAAHVLLMIGQKRTKSTIKRMENGALNYWKNVSPEERKERGLSRKKAWARKRMDEHPSNVGDLVGSSR